MKQENKNLLLQVLCEMLPYGVICSCIDNNFTPQSINYKLISVNLQYETVIVSNDVCNVEFYIDNVKPYLLPMSSMTDEEKKQYEKLTFFVESVVIDQPDDSVTLVDWLNKKKFDYRGLIPMGLALSAPEGMYDI